MTNNMPVTVRCRIHEHEPYRCPRHPMGQPEGLDLGDIGLSVDMLDVDRLREWARLLLVHGTDLGHWGSVTHVAGKMQLIATGVEKAIEDIGRLRAALSETKP